MTGLLWTLVSGCAWLSSGGVLLLFNFSKLALRCFVLISMVSRQEFETCIEACQLVSSYEMFVPESV